jgi:CRP/FNR family transcriptional regulator
MFDSTNSAIHVGPDFLAPDAAHANRARSRDTNWASARFADLLALLGVALPTDPRLLELTFPVRKVKAGETLHRAGDKFKALYIIRCGFFKTVSVDTAGQELVLDFPMSGDVVGLDGIHSGAYTADVVALDLSNVAVIPFTQLAQLIRTHRCLEHMMYSLFSRELAHKQGMTRLLGTLGAEARIATFLLDLSDRFGRLGYSRHSFALRATREEIGSYLGLKLETVSRALSAFDAAGLIEVDRRDLTLCDIEGLRRVVSPAARSGNERKKTDSAVRSAPAHARLGAGRYFALAA